MMFSRTLALSGTALLIALSAPASAQSLRTAQQCEPAVANPSLYGNCRLRIVHGNEVCRCAILPRAIRPTGRLSDPDAAVTGSIGAMTPLPADVRRAGGVSNFGGSLPGPSARPGGRSGGENQDGGSSQTASGGNTSFSRGIGRHWRVRWRREQRQR